MKHPKALPYLFFSEMWERFGYYLMIGIFTLYLKDTKAGFGLSEKESADLYGTFIALVFFTPFLGGLIADRYWGYRKSIIVGGLLMGAGYCLMGVHSLPMLYLAMTLVIIGNGFFKPNISTLLGNVYNEDQFKTQKDAGYNIFYMGINIGAFVCNFFGALFYNLYGWQAAFYAAGIGMFIGVVIFMIGTKHYQHADVKKGVQAGDMSFLKICLLILLPSVICGTIGYFLYGITGPNNPEGNVLGSDSTDAFLLACIPVAIFYYSIYKSVEKAEKSAIAALLAIFSVVIIFWAVFKQNGSALTTWADKYTDRTISNNSVFEDVKLAAPVTYKQDSITLTDAQFRPIDAQFRPIKQNGAKVKTFAFPDYFKNAKTLPAPNEKVTLWNTPLSQSINPGWVILLTPVVVGFFSLLRKRKKEPSTASKITLGLLISALSTLVMVAAAKAGHSGVEKVSVWWLISAYGVITIGELMLSPMGLSLVSKLSPARMTSVMMGGWFLSTSIGNKLSGVLASQWDKYDDKGQFFLVNFGLLIAATILLFAMLKWLNKVLTSYGIY
jgi:proton-dependent oligopeptide transporter, POT family